MRRHGINVALVVLVVSSLALLTMGIVASGQGVAPATPPAPASQPATAPASEPTEHCGMPMIGDSAPAFKADTTQGPINFPDDFKGKWVIFFSHPGDFTPVCTTEFMTFAKMMPDFEALNCKLLGLSVDSNASHIAWLRAIKNIKYKGMENVDVKFPVIADLKMDIARKYGMVHPGASDTKPVRAVFLIDPASKVRAVIYYPPTTGRNFHEIKRLLVAMQTVDTHKCATPADWQEGEDVIVPAPGSSDAAQQRIENPPAGVTVYEWFLSSRKLPTTQPK